MKKTHRVRRARKTRAAVSNEAFVKAWAKADSIGAVAARLGMAYSGAQARVARLRKAGVKLPRFARHGASIDVAALNALYKKARRSAR